MTPEQINIACAERLGWHTNSRGETFSPGCRDDGLMGCGCPSEPIPDFHGSMDAAQSLIEFAAQADWSFSVNRQATDGICQAVFTQGDWMQGWMDDDAKPIGKCILGPPADSLSAAICAAFLKLPKNESRK